MSHRSSACLDISRTARLQYPAGILPERVSKKEKKEKGKKKSTRKQQIQTIISPNEPIIIILTAIQFFSYLCARGDDARSLSYPSPLRSACQPASQAEPGRRNSGHNEIADNKAEDGGMAVTE